MGSKNTGATNSGVSDTQFLLLTKRVEKLESLISQLQKQLEEYRTQKTVTVEANRYVETRDSLGDDFAGFKDLNSRFAALQAEIDHLKNEFARWIKEL